jgi:hypothetical protein
MAFSQLFAFGVPHENDFRGIPPHETDFCGNRSHGRGVTARTQPETRMPTTVARRKGPYLHTAYSSATPQHGPSDLVLGLHPLEQDILKADQGTVVVVVPAVMRVSAAKTYVIAGPAACA